jgi:wobble nucleotide-excising tRNase
MHILGDENAVKDSYGRAWRTPLGCPAAYVRCTPLGREQQQPYCHLNERRDGTGVRLAEQEADLAQRSRGKTTEITTAAKAVQAHVPVSMKIEAFQTLRVADDVDTLIADQEKRVETARQAGAIKDRKALSEFPLPELPAKFEQLLGMTIDDIARDAEARLAAHIAAHDLADGGGNWIAEGLRHADDTCPFCGQEISGSKLIAAFRSVFSERYEALVSDIGAMRATVSQLFGDGALARLETLAEQNKSGAEFWARYVDVDALSLALPADVSPAAAAVREAALELLARKAASPLEAIAVDARFLTAGTGYNGAKVAVMAANAAVQQYNVVIAAKKVATASSASR